jgi:uncharacterized membrane protein YkvA (DUF1232 family)
MGITERIKTWARRIKRDAVTLWFAYRDLRTPLAVKALCAFVVAYALSPIDLIPDFIPVLGYVDDALLLPALIWLAVKLLPPEVIEDSRAKADDWMGRHGHKPTSKIGAVLVVALWMAALWGGGHAVDRGLHHVLLAPLT